MSRVVVHIGLHKTASSALQDTFASSRELLQRHGVLYPKVAGSTAHHALAACWVDLPRAYRISDGLNTWAKVLAQAADQDAVLFLSSEELSRCAPRQVAMDALRELLDVFDEVQVLCVLRNQASFAQSVYTEVARTRPPREINTFVDGCISAGLADGLFLDYGALYDHLLSGFAPGEIHFSAYEPVLREAGGLVGHVLRHLGGGLENTPLAQSAKYRSNVSSQPLAVWLAAQLVPDDVPSVEVIARAQSAIAQVYGEQRSTAIFSAAQLAALAETFEPLNRQFEDRVAGVQAGFSVAPVALAPDTLLRDEVDPAILAL